MSEVRSTGILVAMDPGPIELDELFAHGGWVRRLAARLVRDAASADDVAQEVWVAALRTPPRERIDLRAWLAAAVRNASRSLHRTEARRVEREQRALDDREVDDPANFVQRAESHRLLVDLVLALDEPQRSLVIAHWFEGLTLAAAA